MPDVYHFVFLKEEEDGKTWDTESAVAFLTEQKHPIVEKVENDQLIVLSVAPKPEKEATYRVVSLTNTLFIVVDDDGTIPDPEELPTESPVLIRQNAVTGDPQETPETQEIPHPEQKDQ